MWARCSSLCPRFLLLQVCLPSCSLSLLRNLRWHWVLLNKICNSVAWHTKPLSVAPATFPTSSAVLPSPASPHHCHLNTAAYLYLPLPKTPYLSPFNLSKPIHNSRLGAMNTLCYTFPSSPYYKKSSFGLFKHVINYSLYHDNAVLYVFLPSLISFL